MKDLRCPIFCACVSSALLFSSGFASAQVSLAQPQTVPTWQIVVNNGDFVPGDTRKFNSYNQPSVNINGLVVFRGRSKGGTTGEPAHGVFLRNMSDLNSPGPLKVLFDRNTLVPQPNNLDAKFTEPPSFPRIDMYSNTVASRGSHQPVWEYFDTYTNKDSRAGTTGIYTNPFGQLISGANNLGAVPEFGHFAVPGGVHGINGQPIKFDVFPGAPAVADVKTIVTKGNYTLSNTNDTTTSKTGVYYRRLADAPAGGSKGMIAIADTDTVIPGYEKQDPAPKFGSTAPPSAVKDMVVFAGFDDENKPEKGGIYLAILSGTDQPPTLTTLIGIKKTRVPGEAPGVTFNKLGEGLSFDGRFVAFWGAWGTEVKNLVLQCPSDGNKNVIAYCKELYGGGELPGTLSNDGFHTTVPLHQGIFVYDTRTKSAWAVAKAPDNYSDFVYWNFSGKVPPPQGGGSVTAVESVTDETAVALPEEGSGGGGGMEGETDGEPARWRSASFVAVSGLVDGSLKDDHAHAIFKARTGTITDGAYVNPKDGLYLRPGPDSPVRFTALVETGMDGTMFDPEAIYLPEDDNGVPTSDPVVNLPVTAMGIERDGFRGNRLALNISMGTEEAGWAGIYLTNIAK